MIFVDASACRTRSAERGRRAAPGSFCGCSALRVRTSDFGRALQLGTLFFSGQLARVHYLTESDIQGAWQVFRQYTDKDWSFTDCTSRALMEQLGIKQACSFDQHFRQFGTVTVVP